MSVLNRDAGIAARHARTLLKALSVTENPTAPEDHPALAWRRSGLAQVTGWADRPGLVSPVHITSAANGALAALASLAPHASFPMNGALLLGERARLLELNRSGMASPNGTCRLLATQDGLIAINLPRTDDWDLLPALMGVSDVSSWDRLARLCADQPAAILENRGSELGLAIAMSRMPKRTPKPFSITPFTAAHQSVRKAPVVIDLSSLWAGPLAGSLLAMTGAHVIKVESVTRPDGARAGNPAFFDLLNGMKEHLTLDFGREDGRRALIDLVASADIIIEASRPRALRQLGLDAEAMARAGKIWVSITAHGRSGKAENRIGFGDDVAVASGLTAAMVLAWDEPVFAGDAIADPLAGITAALAAYACWLSRAGALVSVPMIDVMMHALRLGIVGREEAQLWQTYVNTDQEPFYPMRSISQKQSPLVPV
jgi:CoA-transferase family III